MAYQDINSNVNLHKGKPIPKVNIYSKNSTVFTFMSAPTKKMTIPPGFAHRADLLSYIIFGTVTNDWIILMMNNIKDPFQELNAGDTIIIPDM